MCRRPCAGQLMGSQAAFADGDAAAGRLDGVGGKLLVDHLLEGRLGSA